MPTLQFAVRPSADLALKLSVRARTLRCVLQTATKLLLALLLVLNGFGVLMPAAAATQPSTHHSQHSHCHDGGSDATLDEHKGGGLPSKHPCGCCNHGACLCGCSSAAVIGSVDSPPIEHVHAPVNIRLALVHVPTPPHGVPLRPPTV